MFDFMLNSPLGSKTNIPCSWFKLETKSFWRVKVYAQRKLIFWRNQSLYWLRNFEKFHLISKKKKSKNSLGILFSLTLIKFFILINNLIIFYNNIMNEFLFKLEPTKNIGHRRRNLRRRKRALWKISGQVIWLLNNE